jgi:4a-hydroxytetrahydrobiopterin dehydratase
LYLKGIETLRRVYKLKTFLAAMEFANQISTIAEQGDHHPALLIEWGRVTVTWWSHSIGGLHLNDFVMAAKTDEIYSTL